MLDHQLRHARAPATPQVPNEYLSLAPRPTLVGLLLDGRPPAISNLGLTQLPPGDCDFSCVEAAYPTLIRGTLGPRGPPC